jgi:MYXO-CTERM domain-containing protein
MTTPELRSAPAWATVALQALGMLVVLVTAVGAVWAGFFDHGPPLHLAVAAVLGLAALAVLVLRRRPEPESPPAR